ncbi:LysE family translocator [Nautilia sp. PV-1]|jgi:threonine/homoserine/homoserine lactone efflux protein|uniref:LysE family translocator n=1 Tax=Nautilia sp. PV-1 TaxID=2579250 RepID=UPI000FDBC5EC|nr:LysE family translocator [Nautilia sp. PV-1]AZV45798.1 LysE family translocator [Nautilia sp. PV-1]
MDLHNYLGYLIVSVLTITSPGAAILLAINNSMKYDLRAVVFSSFGNILGLFILSLIAMFGVGILIKTSDTFFWILKIVGAVYLIYLGIKHMMSGHKEFHLSKSCEHLRNYSPKKVFVKGFLVAATNPKPILFFTAIFPLFLSQNHSVVLQFFIMTFTFMAISFISLMSYGLISKHAKAWFFDDKSLELFYKISGAIFVLMGIGMLFIKK